ncbi:hypothetical protein [Moorella sp. ACPs]|jgi:hypothetical protein|uniref:hypothetical protein n=1 Tax=Neomoorella carbonis TaxID=3062783 RepID=UPI003253D4D6
MTFSFIELLAAFGGGVFGASVGALVAFIFCGFAILCSVSAILANTHFNLALPLALGSFFGPHISFASAVAAAAYAAKKGKLATGKDISSALMGINDPGTLLVGGLFGVLGYLLAYVFNIILKPGMTDNVALTVFIIHVIARLAFGKTGLFGEPSEEALERGRFRTGGAAVWVPYQDSWGQTLTLGLGVSLVNSWIAYKIIKSDPNLALAATLLGFGISAVKLLFLYTTQVPVTHHITLVSAVATVSSGSIIWGVVFGIIAALLGEAFARIFYIHGDTHIDPPATSIFTVTTLIYLSKIMGLF